MPTAFDRNRRRMEEESPANVQPAMPQRRSEDTYTEDMNRDPVAERQGAHERLSRPMGERTQAAAQADDNAARQDIYSADHLQAMREDRLAQARGAVEYTATATRPDNSTHAYTLSRTADGTRSTSSVRTGEPPPPVQVTRQDVDWVKAHKQEESQRAAETQGVALVSAVYSATASLDQLPGKQEQESLKRVGRAMAGDKEVVLSNMHIEQAKMSIEATGVVERGYGRNESEKRLLKEYQSLNQQQQAGRRMGAAMAKDVPVAEGMNLAQWLDAFDARIEELPPAQRAAARERAMSQVPEQVQTNENLRLQAEAAQAQAEGRAKGGRVADQRAENDAFQSNREQYNRDPRVRIGAGLTDDQLNIEDMDPEQRLLYDEMVADGTLRYTYHNGSRVPNVPRAARGEQATRSVGGGRMVTPTEFDRMASVVDSPIYRRVVEGSEDLDIPETYEGTFVEETAVDGDTATRLFNEARTLMEDNEDMPLDSALLEAAGNSIDRVSASGRGQLAASPQDLLGFVRDDLQQKIDEYKTEHRDAYDQKRVAATDERLKNLDGRQIAGFAADAKELMASGMDREKAAETAVAQAMLEEGHAPMGANYNIAVTETAQSLRVDEQKKAEETGAKIAAHATKLRDRGLPETVAKEVGRIMEATAEGDKPGPAAYSVDDSLFVKQVQSIQGDVGKSFASLLPRDSMGVFAAPEGQTVQEYMASRGVFNVDTPRAVVLAPKELQDGLMHAYVTTDKEKSRLTYDLFHEDPAAVALRLGGGDAQFVENIRALTSFTTLLADDATREEFMDTNWFSDSRSFEEFQDGKKTKVKVPSAMAEAMFNAYADPKHQPLLTSNDPKVRNLGQMLVMSEAIGKQQRQFAEVEERALAAIGQSMPDALGMTPVSVSELVSVSLEKGMELRRRSSGDRSIEAGQVLELVDSLKDTYTRLKTGSKHAAKTMAGFGFAEGDVYRRPLTGEVASHSGDLASLGKAIKQLGGTVPGAEDTEYTPIARDLIDGLRPGGKYRGGAERPGGEMRHGLRVSSDRVGTVREDSAQSDSVVIGSKVYNFKKADRQVARDTTSSFAESLQQAGGVRGLRGRMTKDEALAKVKEAHPDWNQQRLSALWDEAQKKAEDDVWGDMAREIGQQMFEASGASGQAAVRETQESQAARDLGLL